MQWTPGEFSAPSPKLLSLAEMFDSEFQKLTSVFLLTFLSMNYVFARGLAFNDSLRKKWKGYTLNNILCMKNYNPF